MSSCTCPVWVERVFAGPLRHHVHNPEALLGPYVRPGMWVLDVGCAMGDFSIPMARMLAGRGRVVSIDRQERMIWELARRLQETQLYSMVEPRVCPAHTLPVGDLESSIDFALVFAVAHDVADRDRLFRELHAVLKPGGRVLLTEPSGHVSEAAFEKSAARAFTAGFSECGRPEIPHYRAILLGKEG